MSLKPDVFKFTFKKIGEDKYMNSNRLLNDLMERGFEFTNDEEKLFSKIRIDLNEKEQTIIRNFEGLLFTINSMLLSGFIHTKEEIDDFKKLAYGQTTTEELLKKVDDNIEKLKLTNPELFASDALKN